MERSFVMYKSIVQITIVLVQIHDPHHLSLVGVEEIEEMRIALAENTATPFTGKVWPLSS